MTDSTNDPMKGHSGSLSNLLRAYQQEYDAWRAAAAEVARLRNDVLGAANLEATILLRAARADIGQTIKITREKLVRLVAQTRSVVENDPMRLPDALSQSSPRVGEESGARLVSSSDEIRRILEEAASDLEALTRDALQLSTVSSVAQPARGGRLADPPPADDRPPSTLRPEAPPQFMSAGPTHVVSSRSPENSPATSERIRGEDETLRSQEPQLEPPKPPWLT